MLAKHSFARLPTTVLPAEPVFSGDCHDESEFDPQGLILRFRAFVAFE